MATSISATLPPIAYVPAAAGAQATLLYHEGVTPSEIDSWPIGVYCRQLSWDCE